MELWRLYSKRMPKSIGDQDEGRLFLFQPGIEFIPDVADYALHRLGGGIQIYRRDGQLVR